MAKQPADGVSLPLVGVAGQSPTQLEVLLTLVIKSQVIVHSRSHGSFLFRASEVNYSCYIHCVFILKTNYTKK